MCTHLVFILVCISCVRKYELTNLFPPSSPQIVRCLATVLFNKFNKVKKVYEGSGCDVAGRFGTIVSRDCSKILGENEVLREENTSMRAILGDMNVAVSAPKKLSSPAATSTPSSKKRKDKNEELAHQPVETHNDSCEVCGTGGDLICCSTCNLVFHLGCTRPQLTEVPEGNWNCAYCVAENPPELEVTPQALEEAKRSVEEMDAEKAKHKPLCGKQAKRSVDEMKNAEEAGNEPLAKKQRLNKLKTNPSIFLGGLHTNTDEETIRKHFGKYGEITVVEIMRNAAGTPRGFGFVEFSSDDVVEAALQNEPHVINGNTVSIENSSDIVGFFSSKGKKKEEDDEDDSSSDAFDSSLGHPKRLAYKDDSGGK